MTTILLTVLTIIYFLTLAKKLAILQEKDYWRGRIFADPRTITPQFKELVLLAISVALLLKDIVKPLSHLAVSVVVVMIVVETITIIRRRFKRPKPTARIGLIAMFAVTIVCVLLIIANFHPAVLALATGFTIWVVILANEMARHIVYIGHRRAMRQAAAKLYNIPDIRVVGITGSYGKSTTKEFLNAILREFAGVISTPGSINTDIGLAVSLNRQFQSMSKDERKNIRFAVLEMDAYVIGTIARITKYFPLDGALVTSINEQHLDTFGGDINNTVTGNFQIFEGITRADKDNLWGGFNFDNQYCQQMAERFSTQLAGQAYTYGKDKTNDVSYHDVETVIAPGKESIRFTLAFSNRLGGGGLSVELPLPGEFNASNFAGAVLLAKLLGANNDHIIAASHKVFTKARTLKLSLKANGIEIIDDSFNANPASVEANLNLLTQRDQKLPAQKNILVFTGLFDLGSKSEMIHARLGDMISEKVDMTYITNPLWGRQINKNNHKNIVINASIEDIIAAIRQSIDDVANNKQSEVNLRIMIINRVPTAIYQYITQLPE